MNRQYSVLCDRHRDASRDGVVVRSCSYPGCNVDRLTIKCASCGHEWLTTSPFSVYEQQAVESCPCPDCNAYTLCCHEPGEFAHAAQGHGLAKARTLHAR